VSVSNHHFIVIFVEHVFINATSFENNSYFVIVLKTLQTTIIPYLTWLFTAFETGKKRWACWWC